MINKVVFFLISPLDQRDYKRFGAEIFKTNGFEVVFFDFSPFLYPLVYEKRDIKKGYQGDLEKHFFSQQEALKEIAKLKEDCFVISILHYNYQTYKLFQVLSKTSALYAISIVNPIPTYKMGSPPSEPIFERISRITLPKLAKFSMNYLFQPAHAKYIGIREPSLLLAGGEESLNHPQSSLAGTNTEILWLHTFDYDIYLENKKVTLQAENNSKKAVFIDAPTPRFARDSLMPGISNPLTEEKYYPSLCNFFDKIEKQLGVEVEIAGHPGAGHEKYPDYFGERLTLSGKTFEMIMQSRLVINRNSTAINFVVLSKKPIIFHTSSEAETDPILSGSIKSMASWLGKEPINIDQPLDIDWDRELEIDESAYANYKNAFIKKEGTEDIYLWQTVADRLKEM